MSFRDETLSRRTGRCGWHARLAIDGCRICGGRVPDGERRRLQALASLCASQGHRGPLSPGPASGGRRGQLGHRAHHPRRADRRNNLHVGCRRSRRSAGRGDGAVVIGTPNTSAAIRGLGWQAELTRLGPEGYRIRNARIGNRPVIAIASDGEIGALYGAYHFLRLLQTGQSIDRLDITERPKLQLRMLNHWDNMDGTIERGYAGRSLWQWNELPGTLSPRLRGLRARERLDRDQRHRHQQRQRQRPHPDAGLPAEGRRTRRRSGVRTACACTCRPTSPRRSGSAA